MSKVREEKNTSLKADVRIDGCDQRLFIVDKYIHGRWKDSQFSRAHWIFVKHEIYSIQMYKILWHLSKIRNTLRLNKIQIHFERILPRTCYSVTALFTDCTSASAHLLFWRASTLGVWSNFIHSLSLTTMYGPKMWASSFILCTLHGCVLYTCVGWGTWLSDVRNSSFTVDARHICYFKKSEKAWRS